MGANGIVEYVNMQPKNGHLEVLKWARYNGCHWDIYIYEYAAQNGHLEVLEWARDNSCD